MRFTYKYPWPCGDADTIPEDLQCAASSTATCGGLNSRTMIVTVVNPTDPTALVLNSADSNVFSAGEVRLGRRVGVALGVARSAATYNATEQCWEVEVEVADSAFINSVLVDECFFRCVECYTACLQGKQELNSNPGAIEIDASSVTTRVLEDLAGHPADPSAIYGSIVATMEADLNLGHDGSDATTSLFYDSFCATVAACILNALDNDDDGDVDAADADASVISPVYAAIREIVRSVSISEVAAAYADPTAAETGIGTVPGTHMWVDTAGKKYVSWYTDTHGWCHHKCGTVEYVDGGANHADPAAFVAAQGASPEPGWYSWSDAGGDEWRSHYDGSAWSHSENDDGDSGLTDLGSFDDNATQTGQAQFEAAAIATGDGIYVAEVNGCKTLVNVCNGVAYEMKMFAGADSYSPTVIKFQNGTVVSAGYDVSEQIDLASLMEIPCGAKYAQISSRAHTTTTGQDSTLQCVIYGSKGEYISNNTQRENIDSGDNHGLIDISESTVVTVRFLCNLGTNLSDFSIARLINFI